MRARRAGKGFLARASGSGHFFFAFFRISLHQLLTLLIAPSGFASPARGLVRKPLEPFGPCGAGTGSGSPPPVCFFGSCLRAAKPQALVAWTSRHRPAATLDT